MATKVGVAKPFDAASSMGTRSDRIVICTYQFATGKADAVKSVAWDLDLDLDLVVVDEAHRLRNGYSRCCTGCYCPRMRCAIVPA